MSNPKVSIILPIYGVEKYLPRFHNVEVRLLLTKTKELQIEIIMNQIVYAMIYKSDIHTLSELNSLI